MNSKEALAQLAAVPDSVCACTTCQRMCHDRACWPTPQEAQNIIDAGFGARLMNDYRLRGGPDGSTIHLLCPAEVGRENDEAATWPGGRCTFLTDDGACELHALGLKPSEGRKANHEGHAVKLHDLAAYSWNDEESQKLVRTWWRR